MEPIFVPTEQDFRRWIREELKQCLDSTAPVARNEAPGFEPLLSRKEIARILGISLVTLHAWAKDSQFPFHKQGGRVYYLQSEIYEYLKQKGKRSFLPDPPIPGGK